MEFIGKLKMRELRAIAPKALRHTFAKGGKRNGMTDEQIAYWLGHKTTRMVREHYGHLDEQTFVPEFEISTDNDRYEA